MKKEFQLPLLNIAAFIATIFINYLSVVHALGGKTIRELSDQYDNLFTPSPQTFSIWSLIYTGVIAYLVMQFFSRYRPLRIINSYWFLISCLLNFSWILVWQYEWVPLSFLIMLGLLATLVMLNRQTQADGQPVFKFIFGIYLGWICIATIANFTALLVSWQVKPELQVQQYITIGIIIIAALLVSLIMRRLSNPYLAIAVCWALFGIYSKRITDQPVIAWTALGAGAVVLISALFLVKNPKKQTAANSSL